MYNWLLKMGSFRFLFYILLFIPVFIYRDFTPANELKYISIVEEALANNTWFTFYNHGEIYADKPPLFFWFMMLSRVVTGGYYIGVMGLFSLLPSIGILFIMNKWMKKQHIAYSPLTSEVLLLTTGLFLGATLIIRMDMLMTFFIALSLYTFFRIYKSQNAPYEKYMLPVYIFLGVFSKGAMGILIPLVSITAFLVVKKQWKTFGKYLGWKQWAIMIGLFALWFACVYAEGGDSYLRNLMFKQTVGRGIDSFHHKEPFWFYIPRMFLTFAPWSLLYITLIGKGITKRVIRGDLRVFFATVILSNLILLSVISSKINIYLLPIYPFVVYLCASMLPHFHKSRIIKIAIAIVGMGAVLAFPVSFFITEKIVYTYENLLMVRLGLSILCLGGIGAFILLRHHRVQESIITLSLSLMVLIFLSSFALPQFNKHIGFGEMAREACRIGKKAGITHYAYYKFPTGANIDIYLEDELKKMASLDELKSFVEDENDEMILFVRNTEVRREPDFAQWLEKHRPIWDNGRYQCYLFNSDTPR